MANKEHVKYKLTGYTAEIVGIAAVVCAFSDKIKDIPPAVAVGVGGALLYIMGRSFVDSIDRRQKREELIEILDRK